MTALRSRVDCLEIPTQVAFADLEKDLGGEMRRIYSALQLSHISPAEVKPDMKRLLDHNFLATKFTTQHVLG